MSLTTKIIARIQAQHIKTLDLASGLVPLDKDGTINLTTGTASGSADLIFHDTRTLAASATEDLDLAGSLADAYGTTLTFVKIKAVMVVAATGNTNSVQVTRPASNGVVLFIAAGDGISLAAGEVFLWASPGAGKTVTAATGDLLTVTNSAAGTPVTYDVVIIGTSA
jgi:hypothetical protein